ncbi:LOW QUALITY PROTEIN: hypothetical protein U9M48_022785 [Paspalum notatum var. saurae]|uniref:non-specific serine/threonine protein kinase n=1 Tax=Paspalum notatum var. saurae TaxID=547442 RepID=A0AAQ3TIE3_PASNO
MPLNFGNLQGSNNSYSWTLATIIYKILENLNSSQTYVFHQTSLVEKSQRILSIKIFKLDISYNLLQEEIPNNGVFTNETAVSLKGEPRALRRCDGSPFACMPCSSSEWKHHLTVLLMTIFGFMSLGMSIYAILMWKKMPQTPYLLLHSFGKKGSSLKLKSKLLLKFFFYLEIRFADKSFVSECEALRTIRHWNLLPKLTACSMIDNNGNNFKAIIYEFMPNGNLDTWLHQKLGGVVAPKILCLAQRISIGVDIADALAYLHHDCARPIVHCDLEPTNIILDDDMNAHLGDFSIASLIVDSRLIEAGHSGCSSSLAVAGTIRYIAPEYSQTVHASTCGDVYSFGVVLLEMIIGKRPIDSMFEGGLNITSFVEANFPDQVLHTIDAHLQEECKGFIKAAAAMESKVYQCVLSLVQPSAKLAMLTVLALLLLCYGVGNVHCATVHENSEDFHSLLDFKKGITADPKGVLNNWTNNTHFCHWNGVNCTSHSQPRYRVTWLDLAGHNLAGQISSSLGNLTFLKVLVLSNNCFHGPIPTLNKLQNLQYLWLASNLLRGAIPYSLTNCSNLVSLVLSNNSLTGVIPPRIGFLTKLKIIYLDGNSLSGVIPPGLSNISNLSVISLSQNQLNGSIPSEVWKMPNLAYLYLGENNLSGGIPQTLNLSSLQQLSLTSNNLGSTLPSNFGNAIPNLRLLYLGNNSFEGHIPASLGNASGLIDLDLSSNKFTGQIPNIFGKLSELSLLNLEQNMLEARDSAGWEFFDALTNCSSLEVLALDANNLQGVIPTSIANLSTNLSYLLLSENHLSGIVPSSTGRLNGLISLSLGYNNFTGTIEEWAGKLTNLQNLNLAGNYFVGTIPPSISNLTHLSRLTLANNKFTGWIP